jgi:hypothetical protein
MIDKVSLLMQSLTDFYKDSEFIEKLKPILEQRSVISLRVLDWFITNYAKKHRVVLKNDFDVYLNYKLQLRSYSKKQFDPFCRKNKILFYYSDKSSDYIETSCGQLCFFRWCFQNGVLDYVEKNLDLIESDMKLSIKHKNKDTNSEDSQRSSTGSSTISTISLDLKPEKKRKTLSVSASRSVSKQSVKYTISFD